MLVTAADLADLLDQQPLPAALPAGLQVLDTLEEALELAEATIRARTTTTTPPLTWTPTRCRGRRWCW